MRQTVDDICDLLADCRAYGAPAGPYARATPDAYRGMCSDVLRQSHAHDAADRADASAAYEHGDSAMYLWTRQGPDNAPWVALVTSVSRTRAGTVLNAGYRVGADSPEEAAALADDPSRTLATLVTRFGVSYYTGKKRVYFVPEQSVEIEGRLEALGPEEFARATGLETPPDGSRVAVNVSVSPGEDGMTLLRWLFVLDVTRYEKEMRPPRR
jgi:hypothetical protein